MSIKKKKNGYYTKNFEFFSQLFQLTPFATTEIHMNLMHLQKVADTQCPHVFYPHVSLGVEMEVKLFIACHIADLIDEQMQS